VGAGPAGCAAAYDLQSGGSKVLLVDRHRFPRVKPCAGALTVKAVKRLRYSISPVIRHVARELDISLAGERQQRLSSAGPICVMTVRQEFDQYCLQRTIAHGVEFETCSSIQSIEERSAEIKINFSDGRSLTSRYLVGADGANSQIRRLVTDESFYEKALALEGCIYQTPSYREMRFDFGYVPGGYGWIFPKEDHLNVGLFTGRSNIHFKKYDLTCYAKDILGTDQVKNIIGFPVAVGGENYYAARERIFLVGDAAAMTERLLGEGIHNAIKSGQTIAAAILVGIRNGESVRPIFERSMQEIRRDLAASTTAAHLFYGMQSLGFGLLTTHPARTALMRGFAAGRTFNNILQTSLFSPFYRIDAIPSIVAYENTKTPFGAKS